MKPQPPAGRAGSAFMRLRWLAWVGPALALVCLAGVVLANRLPHWAPEWTLAHGPLSMALPAAANLGGDRNWQWQERLKRLDAAALPTLTRALGSRYLYVRILAADALLALALRGELDGCDMGPALLACLGDTQRRVVWRGLQVYALLPSAQAEPALLRLLDHDGWWLRNHVINALRAQAGPQTVAAVCALARDAGNPPRQARAVRVLCAWLSDSPALSTVDALHDEICLSLLRSTRLADQPEALLALSAQTEVLARQPAWLAEVLTGLERHLQHGSSNGGRAGLALVRLAKLASAQQKAQMRLALSGYLRSPHWRHALGHDLAGLAAHLHQLGWDDPLRDAVVAWYGQEQRRLVWQGLATALETAPDCADLHRACLAANAQP